MPEPDSSIAIQHLPHSGPHSADLRVALRDQSYHFRISRRDEDGAVVLQPTDHPLGTTPPALRDALAERDYYVGSRVGAVFIGPPPWRSPTGSSE